VVEFLIDNITSRRNSFA